MSSTSYRNNEQKVDIIFVCAGNTCRSFTALSFAKYILSMQPKNIQKKISLRSAGVNAFFGKPGTAILTNLLKNDIPNFNNNQHSTMPLHMLDIDRRIPTYIYYAEASVQNRIRYQTVFNEIVRTHPEINIIPICHNTPNIPDPDPDTGTRDDYIRMIKLIKPCVADIMNTHIREVNGFSGGSGCIGNQRTSNRRTSNRRTSNRRTSNRRTGNRRTSNRRTGNRRHRKSRLKKKR